MLVCRWSGTSGDLLNLNCMQTLIAGRKSREREKERLHGVCTRIFCFGLVSLNRKHNVWISQSILLQLLPTRAQNPNLSCASTFVRQSRTFHSIMFTYFLSHAHIFKLTKHSILNTIRVWSGSKPGLQKEKERERERDWCRHVKVNIASADRQVERERERERECVCVCSWISSVYCCFLLWELVYVFQSFVSIFAKKIWSYEMSSGFNSWVQSRTQNYWVRGTILTGIRSRQSERKRFGFLKEERSSVVRDEWT